ncbi:MAG TPA: Crp/Fnr family transcriptional regulator [Erysipelothrix sp.]|nr:Crp/Fnr family transcriptional regulator [Erysipelothrix sp.]
MSCQHCKGQNCIEQVPIFHSLNPSEMMEIAAITYAKFYEKGEMVYQAGDRGQRLLVLHTGKVKVSRITDAGKEQVLRILGPGDFLGELSLFNQTEVDDYCEVIEASNMCIIEGQKLKTLMEKYPSIALKIIQELSQRLGQAENIIEGINHYSVERRLAEALLKLVDVNQEIDLQMSKRDFASYMGMSQETLSRQLTHFKNLGLIDLVGQRKIIVLNSEGLQNIE